MDLGQAWMMTSEDDDPYDPPRTCAKRTRETQNYDFYRFIATFWHF